LELEKEEVGGRGGERCSASQSLADHESYRFLSEARMRLEIVQGEEEMRGRERENRL